MLKQRDVIIAGGGLAGLVAAIHLSRAGLDVLLFEKSTFPRHKVCGEYVSNEILPYLQWLDADPAILQPTTLRRFEFTSIDNRVLAAALPLGGFGISRYAFDAFLLQKAMENGCSLVQDQVTMISPSGDFMTVKTSRHEAYTARFVIGAYGKRTALDQQMGRRFMTRRSPWLAVKAHYRGRFDDDLVALHQFRGGYCGVSKVEGGLINVCYLSRLEAFRAYKNTHDFQEQVLYKNKQLKSILTQCEMTGDNPLSISQISFDRKELIKDHTLMIGDAAGLIHPMCGNGMAMAIHSAKLCAELMVRQFEQGITDRAQLEQHYTHAWKHHFSQRLAMGRLLAAALQRERLSEWMMATMMKFPSLFNYIIRKTHGQYLYQK